MPLLPTITTCHKTSTAEQRNGIVEVRSARDFQMALGLSSIEEATAFSRRTASECASTEMTSLDEESITGTVLLDAQVALSKSALSVSSRTSSLPASAIEFQK